MERSDKRIQLFYVFRKEHGGSERIRTSETLRGPTRFRVVRLQPLGHASAVNYTINHAIIKGMNQVFGFWLGFIIISAVGTIAHFLYDWTNHNKIIGLFAAVNESTWEHIKIALTPTFLWCIFDGFFYGENPSYFFAKLLSLIFIVAFIPLVFYSYRKFAKKSILLIDITIFYLSILFSQLIFYVIINLISVPYVVSFFSCIGLFIFFGCYMTLTLEPIRNFIFRDPITNRYGFKAHSNPFKHKKRK